MTTWRIRLVALVAATMIALAVVLTRASYLSRRDERVLRTPVTLGTSRDAVVEELGEPDFVLDEAGLKRAGLRPPECAAGAIRAVTYAVWNGGAGHIRTLYFDRSDRFVCQAEHLVAV
jgi:hypothetical protein